MKTEVWNRGPARLDMCGQSLPYQLSKTEEHISPGLAKRIHDYAAKRLHGAGLSPLVNGWACTIGTNDADDKPADRAYYVSWKNDAGTQVSIVGILTRNGWPSLDHGLEIAENQ